MKTLTITDAKKHLGRWLAAASRGEDIGIVCGAEIIALRKVEVESTDYAQREYGATAGQVAALFECRGSLALRFVFQDRPTDLFVSFLGNHDEVKALLRSGKYR
jgi:antitoxin (DNA-binding transcriptional repressor) of toxin-antitoxin stability system